MKLKYEICGMQVKQYLEENHSTKLPQLGEKKSPKSMASAFILKTRERSDETQSKQKKGNNKM